MMSLEVSPRSYRQRIGHLHSWERNHRPFGSERRAWASCSRASHKSWWMAMAMIQLWRSWKRKRIRRVSNWTTRENGPSHQNLRTFHKLRTRVVDVNQPRKVRVSRSNKEETIVRSIHCRQLRGRQQRLSLKNSRSREHFSLRNTYQWILTMPRRTQRIKWKIRTQRIGLILKMSISTLISLKSRSSPNLHLGLPKTSNLILGLISLNHRYQGRKMLLRSYHRNRRLRIQKLRQLFRPIQSSILEKI